MKTICQAIVETICQAIVEAKDPPCSAYVAQKHWDSFLEISKFSAPTTNWKGQEVTHLDILGVKIRKVLGLPEDMILFLNVKDETILVVHL